VKRYRPSLNKRKEVTMTEDDSGDWTSLTCYYILHDKVERLQGQVEYYTAALGKQEVLNQRLVKAGDELVLLAKKVALVGNEHRDIAAWNAAKGVQS
jgi:nucleoid-associated protein YgaU